MTINPEWRTVARTEHRNDADGGGPGTLEITFARFDQWTEIVSWRHGRFLERIRPGAFADTFTERAGLIRCLFNHGHDPQIGDKPLGSVTALRETSDGPTGTVDLFDTDYVAAVLPGLAADPPVYGASYRFGVWADDGVVGETWDHDPGRSAHNPDGIPERTLTRVNVSEFGPVTFPADETTQDLLAVRSLTDRFSTRHDQSAEAQPGAAGPLNKLVAPPADRDTTAVAFRLAQRRRHLDGETTPTQKATTR